MADLIDVRQAIADKLSAVTGWQVSPYMLPNPYPPTGHVFPGGVEYDAAMQRGLDMWELTVQVLVGLVNDEGAQVQLDEFLAPSGSRSVKAALEDDRPGPCTLGGLIDDLAVTRTSGYTRFVTENGAQVLGADWTVEIYANGV